MHTLYSWPRAYPQNPYLSNLGEALRALGVRTVSSRYLVALLAQASRGQWVHVHWPEWMLQDVVRWRAKARAAWFFSWSSAARKRGLRFAWTAHNLLGHDELHEDLARSARRRWLAACDVVFGHFPEAEQAVRDLGFRGRFAVTPHGHYGLASEFLNPREQARRRYGFEPQDRVVLSFGAMQPYKQQEALLRQFRAWPKANWRLWLVGSPAGESYAKRLEALARADSRVRYEPRFVPEDELGGLFSAVDATVLAYGQWLSSGVMVMALGHGSPVLAPGDQHGSMLRGLRCWIPLSGVSSLAPALEELERRLENLSALRAEAIGWAATQRWEDSARVIRATLFP